ncbi:MAG: thiamine-phosphate kinase [Halodesulfurarchaeum sp.]
MDERAALSLVSDLVGGAGDDAAMLEDLVFTIDMLHASTDFPAGTTRYTQGWRAVGASLSDVAAMGAAAIGTVAVYGAPDFEPAELTAFVEGATAVSEAVDASYVGGDLDQHEEFTVSSAAIGRTNDPVWRDGATPGEVVCVTGTLGRTAAGVRAFRDGETDLGNDLFQFMPRVEAAQQLAGSATAMMDSSDGLARSLHQIGEASDVGFSVDGEAIPIAPELEDRAGEGDLLDLAVGFGEDFELVCTMPEERVPTVRASLDIPLTVVGTVTEASLGIELDGEELADTGYTHGT